MAPGAVATVVLGDWPTDLVVSFEHITLCCDPSDVRTLEGRTQ